MPDEEVQHHDDTDVEEALKRETHDGPGDIPEGDGDYEEPEDN